jgi:cell division protein FtsQ
VTARRDPAATPEPGAAPDHGERPGTTRTKPRGAAAGMARKRTNPWKALFVVVLMVGLVGAAGWVVLGSRLLVVRHVDVTGMKRLHRAEVLRAAAVPLGTPLARLNGGAVRARVAAVAQVRSVTISRKWPSTLRIQITERTPEVAVAADGRFDLVDAAGVTVATAKKPPHGMPRLNITGGLPGNPAVRAAVAAVTALPPALEAKVRQVDAPDAAHVTLHLRIWRPIPGPRIPGRPHKRPHAVTVAWGDGSRGKEKSDVLTALLTHDATRYDVSSPDVATTG